MGLDSSIKVKANGFTKYYELRAQKLKELQHGEVEFKISHRCHGDGGTLAINVKDSGKGFHFDADSSQSSSAGGKAISKRYYGRGLTLLASLCHSLSVYPPGNEVGVVFDWLKEH